MRRRGFTLVELMIVVAIVGLLASVAIPSFLSYIRNAREAGGPIRLRELVEKQIAYHQAPHFLARGAERGMGNCMIYFGYITGTYHPDPETREWGKKVPFNPTPAYNEIGFTPEEVLFTFGIQPGGWGPAGMVGGVPLDGEPHRICMKYPTNDQPAGYATSINFIAFNFWPEDGMVTSLSQLLTVAPNTQKEIHRGPMKFTRTQIPKDSFD